MTADAGFSNTNDASINLLRGLRSGATDFTFVHRIDACAAAPEDLVAGLEPAPGTGLSDGGYSSVWLFYCPKRFKNARGKTSGHRHRAIAGGDTCWHSETRPKPVNGLDGATICNLSYGRKEEGSGRSFSRMGWCMIEYDDTHDGGGDYVLCKIYRSSSSLAKRKSKAASHSLSGSKRKAAADHAQSLPATKLSHFCGCVPVPAEEEQVHQLQPGTLVTEQSQQNTQFLLPAQEEPDLERSDIDKALQFLSEEDKITFTMDELLGIPGGGEDVVMQSTPSQSQRNTCSSINELLRSYGVNEEALLQFHQNNIEPLFLSEGEHFQHNTISSIDDLLNNCSGTPRAMTPPDAGFSEGFAF
ncbi:unnamed protein product [Urochloa humidicola]